MGSAADPTTVPRRTVTDLLESARARLERLDPAAAAGRNGRGRRAHRHALRRRSTSGRRHPRIGPCPAVVPYRRLDPTSGQNDPDNPDPERQIILVCAHGYSSSLAAATLREIGFSRATDIDGGFEAWVAAGLPVEPAPH